MQLVAQEGGYRDQFAARPLRDACLFEQQIRQVAGLHPDQRALPPGLSGQPAQAVWRDMHDLNVAGAAVHVGMDDVVP